jgi:hypothetical protein
MHNAEAYLLDDGIVDIMMLAASALLRRAFGAWGQGELEDGAMTLAQGRPQFSAIHLDDRAADGQAHARATGLGGVERLEDAFEVGGVVARPREGRRSSPSWQC